MTASTAIKRLTVHTEQNLFYKANLQLGGILKTEHILLWMSDPHKRKRTRKGLLKVEQIHQLARDITYEADSKGKVWKILTTQATVRP